MSDYNILMHACAHVLCRLSCLYSYRHATCVHSIQLSYSLWLISTFSIIIIIIISVSAEYHEGSS